MSEIGLRPHFVDVLPMSGKRAQEFLIKHIEKTNSDCEAKSFAGFVALRIPERRRRFYSPRLILSLDDEQEGKTRITGTFGPNANMWSAFLYSYLLTASAALFSEILGWCQWKIGLTAWGLWIFWPSLGAIIILFIAGQVGKKLGAEQTRELQKIYQSATGHVVEIR